MTTATLFFAAIILSVVIHEAGHMFAARASGMRVSRFFVGFGPTLWSRRSGETEIGVKAFPLGGFVQILGMAEKDAPLPPAASEAASDGTVARQRLEEVLTSRGVSRTDSTQLAGLALQDGPDLEQVEDALARAVEGRYGPAPYKVGSLPWRILKGDESRFYHERPFPAKAFAIASGPLTHAAIALALLFSMQYFWEQPTGQSTTTVETVLRDSPAEAAGLRPGDRILSVDDVASRSFTPMREVLRTSPDSPVAITVERASGTTSLQVTPEAVFDSEGSRIGAIGVLMAPFTEGRTARQAAEAAWSGEAEQYFPGGLIPLMRTSIAGVSSLLSPQGLASLGAQAAGMEERDPEGVVSLVGVTSIAGQISELEDSWRILLSLLAAVNVFLMLFNLIPLPPFDGGHLAVAAIEAGGGRIRRLRGNHTPFHLPERLVGFAAMPVYALLLFLLVASLWLDISSPLRLL